jgi:hypothetical protein
MDVNQDRFKKISYKNSIFIIILGITVFVLSVINIIPTYAATKNVVLPGFASINYSDSIKLQKKGCQEIKFNYVIDETLQSTDTVYIIQLVHKSQKIVYGGTTWFSELTYVRDKLPSMSRIGVLPMKICRSSWIFKANSGSTKYSAVKSGAYDLYFSYGYLDSNGDVLGEKSVIRKPIVLVN